MSRVRNLCLCLAIVATGCQHQPLLVPVDGRVTINGKPAAAVELQFHRTGPEPPHIAIPTTSDAEGRFTTASANSPGILAGKYVVVFSKWAMPNGSPIPPNAKPGEVGARQLIPERYQSVEKPVHEITVSPQESHFDFALRSN